MRSAECGMEGRTSIPHSEFCIPHRGGVVRLDDFRSLVARLQSEIPSEFTGGGVAGGRSPHSPPPPPARGALHPGGGGGARGGGGGGAGTPPTLLFVSSLVEALARVPRLC